MSSSSPAADLATELLAEIFILCLPTNTLRPATGLLRPHFIVPSAADAPLLLCAVCRRWRSIATGLATLWTSLNSQDILNPELVEVWLARATTHGLSLRIATPVDPAGRFMITIPVHPPALLSPGQYRFVMHRHLPVLLPLIYRCKHLEIVDWPLPGVFTRQVPAAPELETLSVAVRCNDTGAAAWVSRLIAQAPNLIHLHWQGPPTAETWERLTHVSWDINENCEHIEQKLAQLAIGCVQHLRIELYRWDEDQLFFGSETIIYSLPTVTTFSRQLLTSYPSPI
ncbi:hypothetical protein B0H16DRAFT_1897432 [Mycena metata]|uniref:F-box domain-containing protein n=1 Tax=Mycena metata TaxID=1033252 RepID=A0AAD7HEH1_9AGAR|nr:hypothetical protein B0H16DRAFT_1897432 [Mycena metata]